MHKPHTWHKQRSKSSNRFREERTALLEERLILCLVNARVDAAVAAAVVSLELLQDQSVRLVCFQGLLVLLLPGPRLCKQPLLHSPSVLFDTPLSGEFNLLVGKCYRPFVTLLGNHLVWEPKFFQIWKSVICWKSRFKIVRTIELHIGAGLQLAITLARINGFSWGEK